MNAKSVGSYYTKEQKEKFKALMKKIREEREKLEQSMHQSMEIYDEHYFNGLPKENTIADDLNKFYGIEISFHNKERSKIFYLLDALRVNPKQCKVFVDFCFLQIDERVKDKTTDVSVENYKKVLNHFKDSENVLEDEKRLRELLRWDYGI